MSTNSEPKSDQDMAGEVGSMNAQMLLYIAASDAAVRYWRALALHGSRY